MNIPELLRLLGARWKLVAAATAAGLLAALLFSLQAQKTYVASAQLYVSTPNPTSIQEAYQGNLLTQQRLASYALLIATPDSAQRALQALGSDTGADDLAGRISTAQTPETAMLTVSVTDTDPQRAAALVNSLAAEFPKLVESVEAPDPSGPKFLKISVIGQAEPPSAPVSPKTTRNVALGAVAGLLLGVAAAVVFRRRAPESG